jgi:hypothetical protein
VAASQLELTGGAQPIFFFFSNPLKTSIKLLLKAQQHKKYTQTTPLNDGVSSLFILNLTVNQPIEPAFFLCCWLLKVVVYLFFVVLGEKIGWASPVSPS